MSHFHGYFIIQALARESLPTHATNCLMYGTFHAGDRWQPLSDSSARFTWEWVTTTTASPSSAHVDAKAQGGAVQPVPALQVQAYHPEQRWLYRPHHPARPQARPLPIYRKSPGRSAPASCKREHGCDGAGGKVPGCNGISFPARGSRGVNQHSPFITRPSGRRERSAAGVLLILPDVQTPSLGGHSRICDQSRGAIPAEPDRRETEAARSGASEGKASGEIACILGIITGARSITTSIRSPKRGR